MIGKRPMRKVVVPFAFVVISVLVCLPAGLACDATHNVSTDGNDSNAGTSSKLTGKTTPHAAGKVQAGGADRRELSRISHRGVVMKTEAGRHLVARIGKVEARFDRDRGWALSNLLFDRDGDGDFSEEKNVLTHLALVFDLRCRAEKGAEDSSRWVLASQLHGEGSIRIIEQGSHRLVIRCMFTIRDARQNFHGEGFEEFYIYPEGEIFMAVAARIVDPSSHSQLRSVYMEMAFPHEYTKAYLGKKQEEVLKLSGKPTAWAGSFDDLPSKYVVLEGQSGISVGTYWKTHTGKDVDTKSVLATRTKDPKAPKFETFPQFFDQIYGPPGWKRESSSGIAVVSTKKTQQIRYYWKKDSIEALKQRRRYKALCCLSVAGSPGKIKERSYAHRNPLAPSVSGGRFKYYDEIDGVYLVRADSGSRKVRISFDAAGERNPRDVRIRLFGLGGMGAVLCKHNGKSLVPQLVSMGLNIDDVMCPPIKESDGPAQEAIVSLPLKKETPTIVEIEETKGIHATYQKKSDGQNVLIWSDQSSEVPNLIFSLADSKLRDFRKWGKKEVGIREMGLYWMACGYWIENRLPSYYHCNMVKDFQITKNGPDSVKFYFKSENVTGAAVSEYWVEIPYRKDVLRVLFKTRFSFKSDWYSHATHGASLEFCDFFPFKFADQKTWCYDQVFYRDAGGNVKTQPTGVGKYEVYRGNGFGLLAGSRGNVVFVVTKYSTGRLKLKPVSYPCPMWADLHVQLDGPGGGRMRKGDSYEVDYFIDIFGDETTNTENLQKVLGRCRPDETIVDIIYDRNGKMRDVKTVSK
ncbi:MAG: hypothetical protein KAV00_03130 [Phycisphaerae bacterium]|nr:hypothetical protein [Phycisphaerae bacterium]